MLVSTIKSQQRKEARARLAQDARHELIQATKRTAIVLAGVLLGGFALNLFLIATGSTY